MSQGKPNLANHIMRFISTTFRLAVLGLASILQGLHKGTLYSVGPRIWDLGSQDPGPRDLNWHAPYMYVRVSLNARLEYVDWSSGTGYRILNKINV